MKKFSIDLTLFCFVTNTTTQSTNRMGTSGRLVTSMSQCQEASPAGDKHNPQMSSAPQGAARGRNSRLGTSEMDISSHLRSPDTSAGPAAPSMRDAGRRDGRHDNMAAGQPKWLPFIWRSSPFFFSQSYQSLCNQYPMNVLFLNFFSGCAK